MTTRWIRWLVGVLCVAVLVGAIYFPILRRQLERTARLQQQSAEQARRELTQPITIRSRRAAGESETILGFGERRWDAHGCDRGIAAFERSRAAREASSEHAAGGAGGCGPAHAAARHGAAGVLSAAETERRLRIFPKRWRRKRRREFRANRWPWIRLRERSRPTCRRWSG